ncbi:DUF982 domain-containing protein [Neorhizobium alkalisoli]|uniref:DUF982 domain-containing protein n=1 Tax=Neorhizobium alkalisoli TaxID=528178 RepID=UPI0011A7473A
MGEVVAISFSLTWTRPVYVGEADLLDTTITGPADALRWMNNHFKYKHGPAHWRARTLCHHALLKQVDVEFARQPFLDAWLEESNF